MSIAYPLKLPIMDNLMYQPHRTIHHPNPQIFNLAAWLLSTDPSKIEAFHSTLISSRSHLGGKAHKKTIMSNSESLVAGVVEGKLIHMKHLTDCAEFLTSLFHSGLKYRTILVYRSMLSAMLPAIDGVPVGQHLDIIRLCV